MTTGGTTGEAARRLVADLIPRDLSSAPERDAATALVDGIGADARAVAARVSRLLDAPVQDLTREAGDGGDIARALAALHEEVDRLDPAGTDLSPGWGRRVLSRLSGAGSPVEQYLARVAQSRGALERTVATLRRGRDQLRRDSVTVEADRADLLAAADVLGEQVALAGAVDSELAGALDGPAADHPHRRVLRDDLLFAVRRRLLDLQQQLAVTQQGVMALDLVLRNTRELGHGVDRALDVTVAALQVAVAVAATPDQARTAAAVARVETLRSAFAEVNRALAEVDRHRERTVPVVSGSVRDVATQVPAGVAEGAG
ncbi:MAG: toxic anion resistance protein [Kineosporiaceae bacterium]